MTIFVNNTGLGGIVYTVKPDMISEAIMLSGEFILRDDTEKEGELVEVVSPRHKQNFIYKYVTT